MGSFIGGESCVDGDRIGFFFYNCSCSSLWYLIEIWKHMTLTIQAMVDFSPIFDLRVFVVDWFSLILRLEVFVLCKAWTGGDRLFGKFGCLL